MNNYFLQKNYKNLSASVIFVFWIGNLTEKEWEILLLAINFYWNICEIKRHITVLQNFINIHKTIKYFYAIKGEDEYIGISETSSSILLPDV